MRMYYVRNIERETQCSKAYRQKNRAICPAYQRHYKENNRVKCQEYARTYRAAKKDRIVEARKEASRRKREEEMIKATCVGEVEARDVVCGETNERERKAKEEGYAR